VSTTKEERAEVRVRAPIPSASRALTITWPAVTIKHDESSKFDITLILR
jgi:hypothetical protein